MPEKNHLFIGLGGTGGKVLRELRKRIYEEFGSNEPDNGLYVDYLYVDSSDDDLNDREGWKVLGKSVHLKTDQKLSIHGISLSMFDQLGQYPGIQAILTDEDVALFKDKLGPLVTAGIGGQRRRLGRTLIANNLAINDSTNSNNFIIRLKSKVSQLTSGAGGSGTQAVVFHICAGLAGGTGSGTVVDVISQIRKEYASADYKIFLYLYVPEINVVNPAHDQDGFYQSNGYAALQELNALSVGKYRPLDITGQLDPATGKVKRLAADTPFDAAYLYTNVNTAGHVLNLHTTLPAAVADFIYQKAIAPGENVNARMGRLTGCENDGAGPEYDQSGAATRSRKFMSFGIKRIEYPETEISDYVTLKYAEQAAEQLQYNYWRDGLGYGERALEEVGTGFLDEIKNIRTRETLLISNGHLSLSRLIIETKSSKLWNDIDSTWETRTQEFMNDVMAEREKKTWLSELSKECEEYYAKNYRVHGVKRFYEIQSGEKIAYASFIRRHIETKLFDEWNAGTKSVLEVEKYTRLLIGDLEERAVSFEHQIAELNAELDGINAAIREDTQDWNGINWLMDAITNRSRNILSRYRDHKRDYYINLTRQEGYAYAIRLIGEIGVQLTAMLNGLLAFKSKLNDILVSARKQAAGKCRTTGDEMITKKYNPELVMSFTKSVTTNADYQRNNANTIRHRMVAELGDGDTARHAFGELSDKLGIDAASDLIYEVCRANARDAMVEASKTDPTLKMVGVNILEKLKEEYNTDLKLENLVRGWKQEAQTYLPMDAKHQAMNFRNAGGTMMSMIQVAIPEMEGDAFRGQLVKAIQSEFPGFNPDTDLSVNMKSNQIVIVSASAGFPLRYVANVSVLKEKLEYKILKDGDLARMSLYGETFEKPLPSLYEMTPAEIKKVMGRTILMGYAMGLVCPQTNPDTGANFDAISFPNQFGKDAWEPLGKNILDTLDKLSQNYALAMRVEGKIEEKLKECRSNEQKSVLKAALGDVLEQRILPLFGGNTYNEEYRKYEALALDILENELKLL
ncbi:MAG: hypothetical protein IJS62_06785 [Bacteroidales bacterium]|nr:hypothetical protein [Bacteroidales bacterium]